MQKVIWIASISMVMSGSIIGLLIKFDKVDEGALLLIAPMIMVGLFLFAYNMSRRNHGDNT